MTELQQIKERVKEHYSRGLSEPIGLPRSVWLEDTQVLITEVERLQEALDVALELLQCAQGTE